ncbi:armadillo-type protein [Tribonema minus]|uniref:Armadillo-type protein n=1 Tax=Tribonema minus TaxID=303371 RepID=A0A836C9V7_9STRA|nr:armadillo-type protein [Tribonema minus]
MLNEEVYKKVLWAATVNYQPTATSVDRQHAFQVLEHFKGRNDCIEYALYMLCTPLPEHNDTVRFFAVHCIETYIKSDWSSMTEEQQARCRSASVDLIRSGTRDLLSEASFVKEKVAALAAEVAERDYPEKWPTFVQDMVMAVRIGPTQAELALMALTGVIQDCQDSDFQSRLASKRRNDITQALNTALPDLLRMLQAFMSHHYAQLRTLSGQGGAAAASPALAMNVVVLNRALVLLQNLVPWTPVDELASSQHDFVGDLLALIAEPHTMFEALGCMKVICYSKGLTLQLFGRLLDQLPAVCLRASQRVEESLAVTSNAVVAGAMGRQSVGSQLYRTLQLRVEVASCLSELLHHNMAALLGGTHGAAVKAEALSPGNPLHERIAHGFDLLLQVLQQPSYRVLLPALPLLQAWTKEDAVCALPFMSKAVPTLLQVCLSKMPRPQWDEEEQAFVGDAVASEEFDDIEIFNREAFMMLRKALWAPSKHWLLTTSITTTSTSTQCTSLLFRSFNREAFMMLRNGLVGAFRALAAHHPAEVVAFMRTMLEALFASYGAISTSEGVGDVLDGEGQLTKEAAAYRHMEAYTFALVQIAEGVPEWAMHTDNQALPPAQLDVAARTSAAASGILEGLLNWRPAHAILATIQLQYLERCFEALTFKTRASAAYDVRMGEDDSMELSAQVALVRKTASAGCINLARALPDVLVQIFPDLCIKVKQLLDTGTLTELQKQQLYEMIVITVNAVPDTATRRAFVTDICATAVAAWSGQDTAAAVATPQAFLHVLGVDAPEGPTNPAVVKSGWAVYTSFTSMLGTFLAVSKRVRPDDEARVTMDHTLYVQGQALSPEAVLAANPFAQIWPQILPNLLSFIRRDLRMKWATWLSQLRVRAYGLLAMACKHRALFLMADQQQIGKVLEESILVGLQHQETFAVAHFVSLVAESYAINCPPALYVRLYTECGYMMTTDTEQLTKQQREFLLVASDQTAYPMVMLVVGALCWPDGPACRGAIKCAHKITEAVWRMPKYSQVIGKSMMGAAVYALVTEPKWMVGLEWDMLQLTRVIYIKLVIGGDASDLESNGGVPTPISEEPRKLLLTLPGVSDADVQSLEDVLRIVTITQAEGGAESKDPRFSQKTLAARQRDALRDLFRKAAKHFEQHLSSTERASSDDSILRRGGHAVLDLPSDLVRKSRKLASAQHQRQPSADVVDLSALFEDPDL